MLYYKPIKEKNCNDQGLPKGENYFMFIKMYIMKN
jgi:hypothetical protein